MQGLSGRGFDVFRCLRLLAFGVTMDGPVGHVWYTFLDKNVMPKEPTSNKAVVLKMLADQVLWAPFFSCVFFAFTNTLAVRHICLINIVICCLGFWRFFHDKI